MLSHAVSAVLLAATCIVASPVDVAEERRFAAPTATIKNGTVVGSTNYLSGIDSFLGIPFAIPPVGTLRLTNPQPLTKTFGTLQATTTPPSCPQFIKSMPVPSGLDAQAQQVLSALPLFSSSSSSSEDCLYMNVQRPAGVQAGAKLPVMAYIYGGGFEAGSASMYDGTPVIQQAVTLGKPVLHVTMGYRIGGGGFLAGKEVKAAGVSNLGLKDQRLALQWIADNIAAFGGDPDKVTIWGESAGAISVFDHTIINGGDNTYNGKPLFVGGIMNSGSIVPALDVDSPPAQNVYDTVVRNAGCASAADTLKCLRSLPSQQFINAANSVPGIFDYQSLDLSYLPRPDSSTKFFTKSPELSVVAGQYSKVPVIIGDQEDEGTLFSFVTSNVTDADKLVTYLSSYFPGVDRSYVQRLVDSYPDDPAQGSPFGTGQLYNLYPEFKRLAAILGDVTFTLTRRAYLGNVSSTVNSWSYLNTYLKGTPFLGTFHGSDVVNNRIFPISLVSQLATRTYYISFAYYQDPNKISNVINWPQYNTKSLSLVNFGSAALSIIPDNFRQTQYETLLGLVGILRV